MVNFYGWLLFLINPKIPDYWTFTTDVVGIISEVGPSAFNISPLLGTTDHPNSVALHSKI